MKKIIIISIFVIFGINSNCFGGDLLEEFRGIKWGTDISYFKTNNFKFRHKCEGDIVYDKIDENLTLGNTKLDIIGYIINEKTMKFDEVFIGLKTSRNTDYKKENKKFMKERYDIISNALGQNVDSYYESPDTKSSKNYRWEKYPIRVELNTHYLKIGYKKFKKEIKYKEKGTL